VETPGAFRWTCMEQFVGKVLSGGANRIRDNGLQRRR